jgi:predicted aminopeptidase
VAWYGQAARGQLEVLAKREDIAELIADPATDPALRERLRTVLEIRRYASDELGLPDGRSYTLYADLERPAPVWNVVATPRFSVRPETWCYPLVGCVAYRGYFRREAAHARAEALRGEGLDVAVFPATAYSTLGWFADPILDSMLDLGDAELAELIFHELSHELFYVPGDAAFNEAFATFVGRTGTLSWLDEKGDAAAIAAWRRREQVDRALTALLLQTREELTAAYSAERSEDALAQAKAGIFVRLDRRLAELAASSGSERIEGWVGQPLNNAHLALVATYESGVAAFERLYRDACRSELSCLFERARSLADGSRSARDAFLDR